VLSCRAARGDVLSERRSRRVSAPVFHLVDGQRARRRLEGVDGAGGEERDESEDLGHG
jgi:hypothetical protein